MTQYTDFGYSLKNNDTAPTSAGSLTVEENTIKADFGNGVDPGVHVWWNGGFGHDLTYDCWRSNQKGGLKAVERTLRIPREMSDLDAHDAVILRRWYQERGDLHPLWLLLKYNREDATNLKVLREKLRTLCRTRRAWAWRHAPMAGVRPMRKQLHRGMEPCTARSVLTATRSARRY